MKNLFLKGVVIWGAGLASVLAFSLPGNASVFYDLEFFDENGELVGTGEFSHEDKPFDETIDLCFIELLCGSIPLEIPKEDNFFRLESFSSTIPGLNLLSGQVESERTDLFWRPFDDELVAGLSPCASPSCAGRVFFTGDSWSISFSRGIDVSAAMTATEWSVFGNSTPTDADGNPIFVDGSGAWTATRRTTVPEPASALGLMAIGALGVGSKLKRS
ncbi:MAG: PEP-CTERM sorting domain-containing protein [Limnoraphis sp. WC205]|nr:PEP-CTERM sorting domain-containing protein [Limnoraphis sp. WC205]